MSKAGRQQDSGSLAADRFDTAQRSLVQAAGKRSATQGEGAIEAAVEFHAAVSLDFLTPSQKSEILGTLGAYEIVEVVGRGGFGIVLKGIDPNLNRVVAIKVLPPDLASDPIARQRFLREARSAAAVTHPHVVGIHEVEENALLPHLVMEYVDGVTLAQRLEEQGSLPLEEILRIGAQIAAGLAAAHSQGLIHRDIKPSNILLPKNIDRIKITDFGLARTAEDAHLTRTGMVAGTPQFMSPEQAEGEELDLRSDLFSLGSVLYTMCTGAPPFRGDNTVAVLRAVCTDEPPPITKKNRRLPGWLSDIVDRLMAKKPGDRMQTASELAELLEQYRAHLRDPKKSPCPKGVGPTRTGKLRSRRLVAASLLLVLLGGFALTEATRITGVVNFALAVLRNPAPDADDPNVAPPPANAPFDSKQARAHQEAWAKYLGKPVEWSNKRGMKFVLIPPGEFTMGASEEDGAKLKKLRDDFNDGKAMSPPHRVRLTQPFYMGEREVRLADFVALMKREPGNRPREKGRSPDGPVLNNCSWLDAIEFCNRLSDGDGLQPAYAINGEDVHLVSGANGYRLPTEAQWEFACRAGTTGLWYHGVTLADALKDYKAAAGRHHKVRDDPNPFGLLHMYASAIEWCWDRYHSDYYRRCAAQGLVVDPLGPTIGEMRIQRGGCVYTHGGRDLPSINSAARVFYPISLVYVGFGRVILPIGAKLPDTGNVAAASLPAEKQVEEVLAKLAERNPGYDAKQPPRAQHKIENGVVSALSFSTDNVSDISPLRALTSLRDLAITGSKPGRGRLTDLSPLNGLPLVNLSLDYNAQLSDLRPLLGMPLVNLRLANCAVTDLSPLLGMSLEDLFLWSWKGSDLTPLKGMPLKSLNIGGNHKPMDLAPLAGAPLQFLVLNMSQVSDLEPLRGMSLETFMCQRTQVSDLSPLRGMPLKKLIADKARITDLAPIKDMPLENLVCDFQPARDAAILRSIPTLRIINSRPAAEFWKGIGDVQ